MCASSHGCRRWSYLQDSRWLIRPPGNDYSPFNIAIHGITPKDTKGEREFPSVWREAGEVIGQRPVVAHNASFDLSVLRSSLGHYGTPSDWPSLDVFCTLVLGRLVWPGLLSYSLPKLSAFLGIELQHHHDPSADAEACAEIARHLCTALGAADLNEAAERLGVSPGKLASDLWQPTAAVKARAARAQAGLEPASGELDPDHPLYGMKVAFTGTLMSMPRRAAAQLLVNAGGKEAASVSGETDFLVLGAQDFSKFVDGKMSSKSRRAAELTAAGYGIEVISEVDFLGMVEPADD